MSRNGNMAFRHAQADNDSLRTRIADLERHLVELKVVAVKRGIFFDSEASRSGSDGVEAWYCVFCDARVDAEIAAAEDVEHLADCILRGTKEGE